MLTALALIALWHFRAASTSDATPAAVAQEYLDALAAHNPTRPQQLATEESRGVLPSVWYTIGGGHAVGAAEMLDARTARLPVEIRVMQPTQAALRLPEVDPAVYRAYRITVALRREGGEWRVDQRQAFQALWEEMRTQNPGTKMPPP